MITISIIITALGLIIAAVGVAFFRHFSSIKTEKSFDDASLERDKLKDNMEAEFQKTLVEMSEHRDSLNKKVEDETTEIISQLKEKSLEAKLALGKLKSQTDKATTEISTEVTKLKETTEKEMEKLSYPLPSDLRATTLSMNIKQEALEEYLPNLRNIFDTDSLLNEHHGQGKYAHTNRSLKHKEVSSELLDNFDNKLIHISLQIGDENGPYSNEKRKLIWTFKTHISLQSDKTHLLYFLDYINNPKEFFRLGIGSNPSGERIDSDGSLRLFSGLKSAMDLCGQTVYLGIQIGDSQILKPPMLSIRSLSFRDNFSRDYNVEFTGTYTSRSYLRNEKFDKLFPDNKMPDYIDTIYLKGKIKCQSF